MEIIVDRIEGDYVIGEMPNGEIVNLSKKIVPEVQEGDVIIIKIDHQKTKKRKENIEKLINDVFA